MIVLDTNTILRSILQDNKEAALLVEDCVSQNECMVPPEVVAEIVFVLLKMYHIDRKAIVNSVLKILGHKNVRVPYKAVVETALHHFGETNFDFVDCLMIGYARVEGHQVLTFDKKLKNMLSIQEAGIDS